DESVTRGTTSIEPPCLRQFHSRGHTLSTAPLANGEAPVSFSFADALRWVRRGIRMPTFTLSARCSAEPSSTDPDQHITYVSFDALTIHYKLQSVKFYRQISYPLLAGQQCELVGTRT